MHTRGPALRPGVALIEQFYRGEQSFVLKDSVADKYVRFRAVEAAVIRTFDGSRSVEEIARTLADRGLAISAATIEAFARTLSRMGVLERSLAERSGHQLERLRSERRRKRSIFRGEWLRMRWAFPDSDAFFTRAIPWVSWCFTRGFIVASVALFAAYAWVLATHWSAIATDIQAIFASGVLTGSNFLLIGATLLTVTMVHELGHGFTCKHFGGDVPELGFMLIYFTPAFYCNVNDSWSFPALRSRLWVTAAGGWIQMVFTSLAALAWLVARPGTLVAHFALTVMLIGGFTTILTNANPLMPLDGYFALSDYLEMPNLRQRAAAYLTWWCRRHLLRLDLPEPDVARSERRLLLGYGALAFLYGFFFFSWIALVVVRWTNQAVGFLGAALVVSAIALSVWPRIATLGRSTIVVIGARSGSEGWRRWGRRAALTTVVVLIVSAVLPWDLKTSGTFAVAPSRTLAIVAIDSGVVSEVYPASGAVVAAGAPLVRMLDLVQARALARQSGTTDSLAIRERLARVNADAGASAALAAERRAAAAQVTVSQDRVDQAVIRARIGGTVMTPHPEWLAGRRVGAGDTLLLVYDLNSLEARINLVAPGSVGVTAGQSVALISFQDAASPFHGVVASVARAGTAAAFGAVEVRVPLPPGVRLQPGTTGEARVTWRRSTLLGAIWWAVRSRIRNDLLL